MPQSYNDQDFATFLEHQIEALNTLHLRGEVAKTVKAKLVLLQIAMVTKLRSNIGTSEQNNTTLENETAWEEVLIRLPKNAYKALVRRSMDSEPPMHLPVLIAHILGSDLARTGHFVPEGVIDEALLDRGQEIGVLVPGKVLAAIDRKRGSRSRQEMIRTTLCEWANRCDLTGD